MNKVKIQGDLKFSYQVNDHIDFLLCKEMIKQLNNYSIEKLKNMGDFKLKVFKLHFTFFEGKLLDIFTSHNFYSNEFPIYNKEEFLTICNKLLGEEIYDYVNNL